jgi:hypothetical protein
MPIPRSLCIRIQAWCEKTCQRIFWERAEHPHYSTLLLDFFSRKGVCICLQVEHLPLQGTVYVVLLFSVVIGV